MSGKRPQILKLSPQSEIAFDGPFSGVVTSYLELRNPSEERVLFKVKTTAPRRYCVRPNSGLIEPGKATKISIMLQPSDNESPSERTKHKFMVQSVIIRDDRSSGFDQIWTEVQANKPQEIMDSKLRCVFDSPDAPSTTAAPISSSTTTTNTISSSSSLLAQPVQQSAPTTTTSVPTTTPTTSNATASASTSNSKNNEPTSLQQQQAKSITQQESASTGLSKSGETVPSSSSRHYSARKDLRPKLDSSYTKSPSTSSHSISSSSILQPMNDDYKIVLVSLAMLILGVILGKYII